MTPLRSNTRVCADLGVRHDAFLQGEPERRDSRHSSRPTDRTQGGLLLVGRRGNDGNIPRLLASVSSCQVYALPRFVSGRLMVVLCRTGDSSYNDVVAQGLLHQAGPNADYQPANHTASLYVQILPDPDCLRCLTRRKEETTTRGSGACQQCLRPKLSFLIHRTTSLSGSLLRKQSSTRRLRRNDTMVHVMGV